MKRPEHIDQWDWDKALDIVYEIDIDWAGDGHRREHAAKYGAAVLIAQALMDAREGQREADAKIAENTKGMNKYVAAMVSPRLVYLKACNDVHIAIRKGGE